MELGAHGAIAEDGAALDPLEERVEGLRSRHESVSYWVLRGCGWCGVAGGETSRVAATRRRQWLARRRPSDRAADGGPRLPCRTPRLGPEAGHAGGRCRPRRPAPYGSGRIWGGEHPVSQRGEGPTERGQRPSRGAPEPAQGVEFQPAD